MKPKYHISRRLSLAAAIAFGAIPAANAATTGFNQTAAGPWDYNTTGNWVGGTINGIWDSSLTLAAAQGVTFAADTTLSTGLTFNYAGNYALTLKASASGTNNLTLGGDINVATTGGTTANVTIGNSTNHLNVNLGGVTRTMAVAASRTLTFSDVVSNGGITKAGAGTLTLSGLNTYTGTTTVNGGLLNLYFPATQTNVLSSSSALALGGGGLFLSQAGSTTAIQTINGVTVNAGASFIGGVRSSGASMTMNLGNITQGSVGGTLAISTPSSSTVTSTASNVNNIIGGWAVYGSNATPTDFVKANGSGSAITGPAYTADTWAAGNNTNVTASSAPTSGSTTNSLRFAAAASNTITMSGVNTITSGGILLTGAVTSSYSDIITGGTLEGSSGGALYINQFSGEAQSSGTSGALGVGGALTINSIIADNTSATALVKTGGSALILGGANTFTGGIYLNQGTLQMATGGSLNGNLVTFGSNATVSPAYSDIMIAIPTLTLNGVGTTIGGLQMQTGYVGQNPIVQNANATAATLTINGSGTNTFTGAIQDGTGGGALSLTVNGSGTQTLSGANTFTGNTLSSNGKIALGNALALQNSAYDTSSVNGGLDVTGYATPTLGGLTGSVNLSSTLITGYGSVTTLTLNPQTGITQTYSGNIINGASGMNLTKSGSGTQILSGTNTYTGATTISSGGGNLRIDAAAALPSGSQIVFNKSASTTGTLQINTSGTNTYNNTFGSFNSSNIFAIGGVANIQNLQGNNTFTGNMNIGNSGGQGVNLQSDAGLLTISGTLSNTVASSQRNYDFGGTGNGVFSGQATGNTTTGVAIYKEGSGTWTITGKNNSFAGGVFIVAGVLNVANVDNTGTNSSIGSGGGITFNGNGSSGTLQYTGSSAVTTNHALTVTATGGTIDASGSGSGTLSFTGTFTALDRSAMNLNYTVGSNTVTNTSVTSLGIAVGETLSGVTGLAAGTTITGINGNTYTLSNAFTGTAGAISTTFSAFDRTLTLTGSNTGANTISSTLADVASGGKLAILKTGGGTWVLSGPNTYTGATQVNSGTLSLGASGSIASTSVSIAAGASLDTTAKTSYTSPASLAFGVDSSGTSGQINATGKTLVISGSAVTINVSGTLTAPAYVLATYGTKSGSSFSSVTGVPSGYIINYAFNSGTQIALVQNTDPFLSWIDTPAFGLTSGQKGKTADPDNDGQNNITEFALDGNPNSGASTGKVVSKVASVGGSSTLVLTLPVRAGATFTAPGSPTDSELVSGAVDGVVYKIQGGSDLTTWTEAVSEVTGPDKITIETGMPALSGAGWTYRTFSSPVPVSGNPKDFLRAVIEAQP